MIKVFGMSASGNCHKIKLLLTQLGEPFNWQEIDILKGESRTEAFLAINPNGRVPTAEIKPGVYLPESNAILYYLAEGTRFLSADRFERADTLHWMFFEQYSHEPYVAVARFIMKFLPVDSPRRNELPRLHEKGYQALDVMERHLRSHNYFVGDNYSIADIALHAYTHVANEGGFDLSRYRAIPQWLDRIAAQPLFFKMG